MIITNVMAVSLDGKIASHPGERDSERRALGFTNDDDREHLRSLLVTTDAVIVGSSSLMASGGAWELANDKGAFPIWAVMTKAGLPQAAAFYQQRRVTRWLVSEAPLAALPPDTGLRNLVTGDDPPGAALVQALQAAGAERVLLFGGGEVNRLFYKERLVDEVILTVCPILVGTENAVPLVKAPLPQAVRLTLVASQPKGNLVFLRYTVQKH